MRKLQAGRTIRGKPYAMQHLHTGLITPIERLPMKPVAAGTAVPFAYVPIERIRPKHVRFVEKHVYRLMAELEIPRVVFLFYDVAKPDTDGVVYFDFHHRADHDDFVLGGISNQFVTYTAMAPLDEPLPDEPQARRQIPTIKLLAGLRGAALVNVIAHEMRHLAQPWDVLTHEERETDAEVFAALYMTSAA